MGAIFDAVWAGSGDLSAYVPALTTPTVNFDDTSYFYSDGAGLEKGIRDGLGFMRFRNDTTNLFVLKPSDQPGSADYFAEVQIKVDPAATVAYILLSGRASTMVTGAWTNGVNHFSAELDINGDGTVTAYRNYASDGGSGASAVFTSSAYPSGVNTITLRCEWEGTTQRIFVDGVLANTHTFSDPNFAVVGNIYLTLNTVSDDSSALPQFALAFGRWRAGTLPEVSTFWKDFVLSEEVDA